MGNVLGNATSLEIYFSPSSSGKRLKNSNLHDHWESKNQLQYAHLDLSYTIAFKIELASAFQSHLVGRK
jgi:hypothetical protein